MMVQERLEEAFQYFGWVRIPDILHQHAEEAAQQNIAYTVFLDKLLQEEMNEKRYRFVQMRTRMAHLPFQKSLEPSTLASSLPLMRSALKIWRPCVLSSIRRI
jgi:DNA replication protein DnaC